MIFHGKSKIFCLNFAFARGYRRAPCEGVCERLSEQLVSLHEILMIAARHKTPHQFYISAFCNGDMLIVFLKQALKFALFLGQLHGNLLLIQAEKRPLFSVRDSYQISSGIMYQKILIGKALTEEGHDQRHDIVIGFDFGIIDAALGALKSHEALEAVTLDADAAAEIFKRHDIRGRHIFSSCSAVGKDIFEIAKDDALKILAFGSIDIAELVNPGRPQMLSGCSGNSPGFLRVLMDLHDFGSQLGLEIARGDQLGRLLQIEVEYCRIERFGDRVNFYIIHICLTETAFTKVCR